MSEIKLTDDQRAVLRALGVPIADSMRDHYRLAKQLNTPELPLGGLPSRARIVMRQLEAKGLAERNGVGLNRRVLWKLTAEGHALLKALLELRA